MNNTVRLVAFAALCNAVVPFARAACVKRIASTGPTARTVVVAGGDAWSLFQQFLSEAKQKDLDVSLWKSKVLLATAGRQETIELGWAKMLTGESSERLWEKALKGKKAELSQDLLAQANNTSWDVICVGSDGGTTLTTGVGGGKRATETKMPLSSEALLYFKSGLQYAARGDYGNALKEFQVVERIDPRFPDLQMNIGVTYMQRKDYVRASGYLSRAIEQTPASAQAYYNMACLQARLGQSDDAIASLANAKSRGFQMTKKIRNDADFAPLRGHSDFEALFAGVKEH